MVAMQIWRRDWSRNHHGATREIFDLGSATVIFNLRFLEEIQCLLIVIEISWAHESVPLNIKEEFIATFPPPLKIEESKPQ